MSEHNGQHPDPGGHSGAEEVSEDNLVPTVMKLTALLESVTEHLATLDETVAALMQERKASEAEEEKPAEWAWFPVPERSRHPPASLALWVQFYNTTYVTTTNNDGADDNRAIPECWLQHPGLAAEIATLAAAWRSVFLGPAADPAAAQNWHDRWRTGFASRLRGWAPCSSDRHFNDREASPAREQRFTDAESTAQPATQPGPGLESADPDVPTPAR
ncbi:MAG: hypothetical protein ACXVGB_08115 [Mycobacteriaceae bacterium]